MVISSITHKRFHLHDPELDRLGRHYASLHPEHLKKTLPYAWAVCAVMQIIPGSFSVF